MTDAPFWFDRFRAHLAKSHDFAALVVFRIALGLLISVSALRFLAYGWVDELFTKPSFFFKYWGFEWVRPLPGPGMGILFVVLLVLGVCFAAGAFYRLVAPSLFLLFSYVQLLDVTNWLNHYYLVSLLLLLASFMPLGRAGSVDAWRTPKVRLSTFPAWCTYLLRFQVGVVYFYAGIAKLTGDWLLHAQPLDIWLHARTDLPVFGPLFGARVTAYAFAWGGFLFDTTIVFFLLWKRTRPYAYCAVLLFHATVGMLFPIGMFPWIMVSAALVFLSPSWPRRFIGKGAPPNSVASPMRAPSALLLAFAGIYCALQILIPLRHRLYGGNVLWHEQGMRFSWKVMVREKNGSVTYVVVSPSKGRRWYVEPRRYLTDRQERELSGQPDLILQLAHHIVDDFRRKGAGDVQIYAEAMASLNGRAATPIIDPSLDLARIENSVGKARWIAPEPHGPPIHLRSRPWNVALLR